MSNITLNKEIELLAPARDSTAAKAAIQCGADAVYLGAPQFSARQDAGNTIDDIRKVVEYAHPYFVKIYAALNTLLFDKELPAAQAMIHELYAAGVDGLIIQDMGLLELDLPPIPVIASTQANNATPEKVKFLEAVGFSRVILARELTLEQIRDIRRQTTVELECFVHGALCVGMSGQCYMSYAIGGRSGNRGSCAQPCRRLYTLKDKAGNTLIQDRYLLSIKDLNLSEYLGQLIDAGITSFKIEGRLKEADYVANVVGYYRQKLDAVLAARGMQKSSSGRVQMNFVPDTEKTFNRGYTDYGIAGRAGKIGSIDTPKSLGQYVGTVVSADKTSFSLDTDIALHNGDGLCFFADNKLAGTTVNGVEERRIRPRSMEGIRAGLKVYRNLDIEFRRKLDKVPAERKIGLSIVLRDTSDGVQIEGHDEDGIVAVAEQSVGKQLADRPEAARKAIETQLAKLGNTIFTCTDVRVELSTMYFFTASVLNEMRRSLVQKLIEVRLASHNAAVTARPVNELPANYPGKQVGYDGNVLNEKARAFYQKHGVEVVESAAESGLDMKGRRVMTTKYCLREQLGLCGGQSSAGAADSLFLMDEEGRKFRIDFRCGVCGMAIYMEK
ncbi:MAG: U32 family peptidase [Sedimentisphaerales bacterium]|nr:U32 family peptidase [Sedimentisphaerales bacterium]